MTYSNRYFERMLRKAKSLVTDRGRVGTLVEDGMAKAAADPGVLKKMWNDLMTLLRLLKAWWKGTYRGISRESIILVIAAVVYFVSPIDLIPDWIPGAGYLDDAMVISMVVTSLKEDIDAFREWERDDPAGASSGAAA